MRRLPVLLVLAVLAGCGEEGPGTATTTVSTPRSTVLPTTRAPAAAGKLTRAESCRQFTTISADYRMNDEQSFVAFSMLAQQTTDPMLAAAIQRVADGFRRHDDAISSAPVQALCR